MRDLLREALHDEESSLNSTHNLLHDLLVAFVHVGECIQLAQVLDSQGLSRLSSLGVNSWNVATVEKSSEESKDIRSDASERVR